jgi:leucyl-tRNA synthetase
VSGKLRGQVVLLRGASREEALAAAEGQEAVAKWLEGKERVKVVFVPDRLLNIVVK